MPAADVAPVSSFTFLDKETRSSNENESGIANDAPAPNNALLKVSNTDFVFAVVCTPRVKPAALVQSARAAGGAVRMEPRGFEVVRRTSHREVGAENPAITFFEVTLVPEPKSATAAPRSRFRKRPSM